jgi:polar amino acid transport system substrate-binding protein
VQGGNAMKRIVLLTLSIFLAMCLVVQAGEIERIKTKGHIVVSLNKGYPPFCMEVHNELTGLDVDLAKLIGDYLGVKVKFVLPALYKDQIPKLIAGESDIIIAAMTRTPERGLLVNFTEPYFEVSQAALVARDRVGPEDDSYFDLVGIKGLRIGVKAGTTIESFARELFPAQAIRTYPGHPEAVAALLRGEVDATVHDSPFVQIWAKSHPELSNKIKPLLTPVTKEYYGFAIRKGDPDFLNWLNLFITEVQIDGTMDLLKHRYFVEMPWLGLKPTKEVTLTKAQLMRNKFIAKKQELLERKRREEILKAGAPY